MVASSHSGIKIVVRKYRKVERARSEGGIVSPSSGAVSLDVLSKMPLAHATSPYHASLRRERRACLIAVHEDLFTAVEESS